MGLLLPEAPRTVLLALPEELNTVLRSWKRVSHRRCLHPVDANGLAQQLFHLQQPVLVALSQGVCHQTLHCCVRCSPVWRCMTRVKCVCSLC